MKNSTPTIKGKIVLQGQVTTCSPLHIGSGTKDHSGLDIVRDGSDNAYIPATSFVGVLSHTISDMLVGDEEYDKHAANFWGYTEEDNGHQSSFRCADLVCQEDVPTVIIRDGIAIDHVTGIAKDTSKYDYELVEPQTTFTLNMEFTYKDDDEVFVKRMVATIYTLLKDEQIRIGAKTNSGFGEILLDDGNIFLFDFGGDAGKEHVRRWLTQTFEENNVDVSALGTPFELFRDEFCIDATLYLKNSLIIRSYSDDPNLPDAIHIKSGENWVLTGTSLKGAIRARAERILKTLGKSEATTKHIIENLFGHVDTQESSKNAKKGRLRVKEVILPKYSAEQQTRIRIDRFTGGTIEGALFDSMPVFDHAQQEIKQVQMLVDRCEPHEAGLLLLVLKDLWSGDLAVGGEKNVGRGVFQGVAATISWKDKKPIVIKDISQLSSDEKKILQEHVDVLKNYKVTPEIIEFVWRKIVEAIDPIQIILFGSQATGKADKESDLDLFVLHDLPESSRNVRRRLGQLFLHRRFGLDLIVRNQEQVEANVADRNPFYTEHIFKRGVVLYDRRQQKTG